MFGNPAGPAGAASTLNTLTGPLDYEWFTGVNGDTLTSGGSSAAGVFTPRDTVAFSESEVLSSGVAALMEAREEEEETRDAARSYGVDEDESPERTGTAAAASATDILGADPDPSFDDTTPREVLEELIKAYQAIVGDGKSTTGLEDFQRKLIEHAAEWNSAYQPPCDIRDMRHQLAQMLLAGTNNPDGLAEAHTILHNWRPALQSQNTLTPCAQAAPVTAFRSPIDELETIKQSAIYCTMAELGLRQYDDTKTERYLGVAAKWAKRCFKLRLELRDVHGPEFEEAVHLLIAIFNLQQLPVAADVLRDMYLQPGSTPQSPGQSPAYIAGSPGSVPSSNVRRPSTLEHQACGYDIDELDDHGFTKLIRAVRRGDIAIVGRCCDEWRADIEVPDAKGKSALLHAVERKDPAMVTKLLDLDADIENTFGDLTVLHHAIQLHRSEMVEILLARGAQIKTTIPAGEKVIGETQNCDLKGRTTLMYAVLNSNASEDSIEIISTICGGLEQSEKDVCDSERFTALHHALSPRNGATVSYALVKTLLDRGVSLDIRGPEGETPLFSAVKRKKSQIIELLSSPRYATETQLNKQNAAGRTALYIATKYNGYETVRLLLDRGAKFDQNGSLDQDLMDPGVSPDVSKLIKQARSSQPPTTPSQAAPSSQRSRTPSMPSMTSTPSMSTDASSGSRRSRLARIGSSLFHPSGK